MVVVSGDGEFGLGVLLARTWKSRSMARLSGSLQPGPRSAVQQHCRSDISVYLQVDFIETHECLCVDRSLKAMLNVDSLRGPSAGRLPFVLAISLIGSLQERVDCSPWFLIRGYHSVAYPASRPPFPTPWPHSQPSRLHPSSSRYRRRRRLPRRSTRPNKNHLHRRERHRRREYLHPLRRREEGQTAGEDSAEKHDEGKPDDGTVDVVEREDRGCGEEGREYQGEDLGDARGGDGGLVHVYAVDGYAGGAVLGGRVVSVSARTGCREV